MPATTLLKNIALDAAVKGVTPPSFVTHVGLQTKSATKNATTPFGVASTDLVTSTGHGVTTGDMIIFLSITGGTGIIVGHPYFVIATGLTANDFKFSQVVGGTAHDFTTDLTAATFVKLTEVSGGAPAYARKAIAWAVAANEIIDDSTNGAIVDVPAAAQIDYVSGHTAVTAGSVMFVNPVTQEVFAAQGTYTVTDAKVQALD